MRYFKAALLACVLAAGACALNPDTATRDRLGVQVATMAFIEHAGDPAAKAARVTEAVKASRTLLDLADVSVADLRVALLARVAERELSPLEKIAALELINALADEVEKRLGTGLLTADQRVTVNAVLDWVAASAALYVPK